MSDRVKEEVIAMCRAAVHDERLSTGALYGKAADMLESLQRQLAAVTADADYYKWRLKAIIPLFEEARDALPAIPLASAKLRNIDLTLGDRMDAAGTATRADFDALVPSPADKPDKPAMGDKP